MGARSSGQLGAADSAVTIRPIRPDEGAAFRAIRLRALADSPAAFGSTLADTAARPPSYWDARARGDTGHQESALFVAEVPGGWVGLVGCFGPAPGDPPDAELISMWVDPGWRGRGIGQRLVERVVDWARQRGMESVVLWVTEGNMPAAALYERCGFRDTGDTQTLPSDETRRERKMVMQLVE